ncbi:aromatic-ring hydroxylase C-terminal domain-containing protein [Actinoallomurus sp. NBC_01490]|uniref:aromatic-ring hydroxylase C-terminal domain-containing protein n=1 Tax=Actinoallomurus sp. NBC_01490 TaxID=2903557 RepID=UPI003FA463ED
MPPPDQPLAALVRPDGHVAWVTPDGTDAGGLRAALVTWLGAPAGSAGRRARA